MTLRVTVLATVAMMAMASVTSGASAQGTRRHVTPGGASCLRYEPVQKSYYIEANWVNICDYEIDITISKSNAYESSTYTRTVPGSRRDGTAGKYSEALTGTRERVESWYEEFY